MRPKPIIGVPADRRVIDPHPYHLVGEKYLKALVDAADAVPLVIPVLADDLAIDELFETLDGVLLTGSQSDIEPHHYGHDSEDETALRDPHRDATTLPMARHALDAGIPLFAICRGCQELNVVLGGTLHQQVHRVSGMQNHKEDPADPVAVQYGPSHPVNLVEGGLLHRLAGGRRVVVNSLHGQGVKRLAEGATVEAVADDGLVEAFTVNGVEGFALAVQWHPEWQTMDNRFYRAMFQAFGAACRQRAGQRAGGR